MIGSSGKELPYPPVPQRLAMAFRETSKSSRLLLADFIRFKGMLKDVKYE